MVALAYVAYGGNTLVWRSHLDFPIITHSRLPFYCTNRPVACKRNSLMDNYTWRHNCLPWLLAKTYGNHWGSDNKATAILKLDSIWCLSKVNAKVQLLARVWNFEWSLQKKRLWRNRWFHVCIVGIEVPVGLVQRIFQTRSSTNIYWAYQMTYSVCYSHPVSSKRRFCNLTATIPLDLVFT